MKPSPCCHACRRHRIPIAVLQDVAVYDDTAARCVSHPSLRRYSDFSIISIQPRPGSMAIASEGWKVAGG